MKFKVVFILVTFVTLNIAAETEILRAVDNYGIFGGEDAVAGQFPYQVSIQYCITWPWMSCSHYCGGSIISPSWILTAGHCYKMGLNKIYVGILNLSETSDFKQVLEINQTFVHEDYIGNANPNDIRLYQLKTPLVYNDRVQPIGLPLPNSDATGEAVASGWGYTSDGIFPNVPDTLQFQKSNILDGETCLKLADASGPNHFNATTNVCTENPESNHGICSGDSGGPLVQNGTLIGISAWGFKPCGRKNAPSGYTRVSNYIEWIKARVPEL